MQNLLVLQLQRAIRRSAVLQLFNIKGRLDLCRQPPEILQTLHSYFDSFKCFVNIVCVPRLTEINLKILYEVVTCAVCGFSIKSIFI